MNFSPLIEHMKMRLLDWDGGWFSVLPPSSRVEEPARGAPLPPRLLPFCLSPPPLQSSLYLQFFSRMCLNLCSVGVLPLPFFVGPSVVSDFVRPRGLQPTRLLCLWDSPGKNTGVGSHSLLQGIFLTQGLNPGFLHHRQILYGLSHQGRPLCGGVLTPFFCCFSLF